MNGLLIAYFMDYSFNVNAITVMWAIFHFDHSYVLDGYPVTKHQVDLMTEHSILPVVVLELTVDSRELMVRGMRDRHSTERLVSSPNLY